MSEAHQPVFEFRDGVLRIASPNSSIRLRWTPEALAEELQARHRWVHIWPDFRILRPQKPAKRHHYGIDVVPPDTEVTAADQKVSAFQAFREQLPGNIAKAAEIFCSHQWPLLEMLSRQSLALDLATSNPVLAYALANNNIFRHTRVEAAGLQAAGYSLRKQRWILEWLGFPGTKSTEKILRKILPETASPYLLRRLKFALQSSPDTAELLGHQPVINATTLEIVTNQHILGHVTPTLLEAAGTMKSEDGDFSLGDKILGIITMLHEIAPERDIQPFRSPDAVQACYDAIAAEYDAHQRRLAHLREERLAEERRERDRQAQDARLQRNLHKSNEEKHRRKPFPPPPLPGTVSIQPITSTLDLQIEAQTQHNCVATYDWKVKRGGFYIYRITAPERATLAIFLGTDGCWRRSELKATSNRKVKRATVKAVDQWLDSYRISI